MKTLGLIGCGSFASVINALHTHVFMIVLTVYVLALSFLEGFDLVLTWQDEHLELASGLALLQQTPSAKKCIFHLKFLESTMSYFNKCLPDSWQG